LPFTRKYSENLLSRFGVVLFEMATGSPGLPLKSETDRVKKINENVKDTKLRSLIVDCCRQDPKKRVTIGQCVEALKVMKKHLNSGS
jgi:serine/threonine protein kinase